MKQKTILVNFDGYMYIKCEQRKRWGSEITQRFIDVITKNFNYNGIHNSKGEKSYEFYDGYTDWSIDELTSMLDEKKLPYEFSERDVIYI